MYVKRNAFRYLYPPPHPSPNAAYMSCSTGTLMVWIMVCRLFGDKSLPQPIMNSPQSQPKEVAQLKISQSSNFYWRNCTHISSGILSLFFQEEMSQDIIFDNDKARVHLKEYTHYSSCVMLSRGLVFYRYALGLHHWDWWQSCDCPSAGEIRYEWIPWWRQQMEN